MKNALGLADSRVNRKNEEFLMIVFWHHIIALSFVATVEGKFIAFEDYNEDEDEGLISVAPW